MRDQADVVASRKDGKHDRTARSIEGDVRGDSGSGAELATTEAGKRLLEQRAGICYICPSARYTFAHSQSTGHAPPALSTPFAVAGCLMAISDVEFACANCNFLCSISNFG